MTNLITVLAILAAVTTCLAGCGDEQTSNPPKTTTSNITTTTINNKQEENIAQKSILIVT